MPRAEAQLASCNQIVKVEISTTLEVFRCFETKRLKLKQILHENIHSTRD